MDKTIWSYCTCDGEHHDFILVNGQYVCEKCKNPLRLAKSYGTIATQSNSESKVNLWMKTDQLS